MLNAIGYELKITKGLKLLLVEMFFFNENIFPYLFENNLDVGRDSLESNLAVTVINLIKVEPHQLKSYQEEPN